MANVLGPENLLPLKLRGVIRLRWPPYERRSRFEFKPHEQPIYRIFIAPEGTPASQGRLHVTYETAYPFTNLEGGRKYNILVDVEQNGQVVLPERVVEAQSVMALVKWYAAPRAEGGSPANPGTYDQPVDVEFLNAHAGPGDVVVLKSGVYFSPAQGQDPSRHDHKLHPGKSGAPGAHILYLAESNDIRKPRYVSFRTVWGNIWVNRSSYHVFDGINCDSDQGRNAKALTSIFGEYGHRPTGVIVRNTYYRAPTSDKHIMVNAAGTFQVENCFFAGSLASHNVYLCNNTQGRPGYTDSRGIFRNCISMNSTRNNVHANGFFDNFIIENNIMVGAEVANISLATVHRNAHVRNNLCFSGAKQSLTLNFYHGFVPLEDKVPSANIHICHNTFLVPDTTEYAFAPIIVSDSRREPHRHTIQGLKIKNNILVVERKDSRNAILNLVQSRHLNRMEVRGNVFHAQGNRWGYLGEVRLPERSSAETTILPFSYFEEQAKKRGSITCLDQFLAPDGAQKYETIDLRLGPWSQNKRAEDLDRLFQDRANRDFRLPADSPAAGAGVKDPDTRRIVRDLYGNIRDHGKGTADAGAIAADVQRTPTPEVGEYRLLPPEIKIPSTLPRGKRTRVAAARIRVRSSYLTVFRSLNVAVVLNKRDKNRVVDVQKDLVVEAAVNGVFRKITFYRRDQAGYEEVYLSGWGQDYGVAVRGGEALKIEVYVTLKGAGNVDGLGTTIAHNHLWGFDERGWKLAVTGHHALRFGQRVPQ
jgi:hypothetical protein